MINSILFFGILSAYALNPTVGTLEYRQDLEQLPIDVSGYEVMLAVNDCSLIGQEAVLIADGVEFSAIIFDCAGADGVGIFSRGNDETTPYKLAADADWFFWQAHPEIVHSLVTIKVNCVGCKDEIRP